MPYTLVGPCVTRIVVPSRNPYGFGLGPVAITFFSEAPGKHHEKASSCSILGALDLAAIWSGFFCCCCKWPLKALSTNLSFTSYPHHMSSCCTKGALSSRDDLFIQLWSWLTVERLDKFKKHCLIWFGSGWWIAMLWWCSWAGVWAGVLILHW